jgi:hypothetical protein
MLVALSNLASAQAQGTEATNLVAIQLLDYCATHSEASICYCASKMALHIHSDASYLSVPKGRSCAGGHLYLGSASTSSTPMLNNGAVLTISGILKHVMSSAAEAEVAGLFVNTKEEKSYKQPSMKWAAHKNPRQSRPTIPLPVALPTTPATNNAPAPLTCDSTGCTIA